MENELPLAEREFIFAQISLICISEQHFNELQTKYRSIASVWMLAAFAAAGYTHTTLSTKVNPNLVSGCMLLMGALGLLLLWIIDLLVYHKLLDSYFLEGLVLERNNPWLPQVRHNMVAFQQGKGVLVRVVSFYVVSVSLLVILGGFSLAFSFGIFQIGGVLSVVTTATIVIVLAYWMPHATLNKEMFMRRLNLPEHG